MAAKPTLYTAELDISDMERNYYRTHTLSLSRAPNETEERLMMRILAFACQAADGLSFGEGPEEPSLWKRDGAAADLWIEIGEPDEKRLAKACGKAKRVLVYAYASSAHGWWAQIGPRLEKDNLTIFHVLGVPTSTLSKLVERNMKLHCMIQDGQIWITGGDETVQLDIDTLKLGTIR